MLVIGRRRIGTRPSQIRALTAVALTAFLLSCDSLGGHGDHASFTVVYHAGYEGGGSAVFRHRYGEEHFARNPMFSRDFRSLTGWARSQGGAVEIDFGDEVHPLVTRIGETIDLFAVWRPHTFTVVYRPNRVSYEEVSSDFQLVDAANNWLATVEYLKFSPPHAGWTFLGWAMSEAGHIVFMDGALIENLGLRDGETVPLYAQWGSGAVVVSFHANGGTWTAGPLRIEVSAGNSISLPDPTDGETRTTLSRDGHSFEGWTLARDDLDDDVLEAESEFRPDGDVTLFARWHTMGIPPTLVGRWYDHERFAFAFTADGRLLFPRDTHGLDVSTSDDWLLFLRFGEEIGSAMFRVEDGVLNLTESRGGVELNGTYVKTPGAP